MRVMTYGQYPFWLKNQADNASADAYDARREANKIKEQLVAINAEIDKYKSLGSNIKKEQLTEILDKISEILSK